MARNRAARPRFETPPTKDADTWLPALRATARRLGTPLMPWQARGARLLTELRPELCSCHDPRRLLPRWKTVVVSVPRQQGKTTLSKASITTVAESEGDLELFGTAQTRQYAAKHVVSLGDDLAGSARTLRGVGAESVTWPNGSRYAPISPAEGGGHGDSIDFMLIDEGWSLESHVMGGIRPAMIARPHSQLLVISTMGTIDSEVWNRLVARGRDSIDDPDADIAYLEFSAERDEDVWNEAKWHEWMPALGRTITYEAIRSAIGDVEPAEAVRAFANRTTTTLVSIFPADWVDRSWRVIKPPDRLVLSIDVNDSPAGASVSSGHVTDEVRTVVEQGSERVVPVIGVRTIDWRFGPPRWIPELVEAIVAERNVEAIVADFGGPSKQLEAELRAIGDRTYTPILDRYPRLFGADCARFMDALEEETVVLERLPPLADSIAGAHRKQLGDLWVVSRRQMSIDASPVIAAIMAHGVASELEITPRALPAIY